MADAICSNYPASVERLKFSQKKQFCWLELAKKVTDRRVEQYKNSDAQSLPFDVWRENHFKLLAKQQVNLNRIHYQGTEDIPPGASKLSMKVPLLLVLPAGKYAPETISVFSY